MKAGFIDVHDVNTEIYLLKAMVKEIRAQIPYNEDEIVSDNGGQKPSFDEFMQSIGSNWRQFDHSRNCETCSIAFTEGYYYESKKGQFDCETCARHGKDQYVNLYQETHSDPVDYPKFEGEDYHRRNMILNNVTHTLDQKVNTDGETMCQQKYQREMTRNKNLPTEEASEWEKLVSKPNQINLLYFKNLVIINNELGGIVESTPEKFEPKQLTIYYKRDNGEIVKLDVMAEAFDLEFRRNIGDVLIETPLVYYETKTTSFRMHQKSGTDDGLKIDLDFIFEIESDFCGMLPVSEVYKC
jgi:hypothetical protein